MARRRGRRRHCLYECRCSARSVGSRSRGARGSGVIGGGAAIAKLSDFVVRRHGHTDQTEPIDDMLSTIPMCRFLAADEVAIDRLTPRKTACSHWRRLRQLRWPLATALSFRPNGRSLCATPMPATNNVLISVSSSKLADATVGFRDSRCGHLFLTQRCQCALTRLCPLLAAAATRGRNMSCAKSYAKDEA